MIKLYIAPKKTIWWTRCKQTNCRVDDLFGVVRTWWPTYRCYSYSFYIGRFQLFYLNKKKYFRNKEDS